MTGEIAVPPAILEYLAYLVGTYWSGKDPQPVIDALPRSMPVGTVHRLASGGSFGWHIDARLDEIDGRFALEAVEEDRMDGPTHYRVWEDGTKEALPTEWTAYGVPRGASPEEVERIKQRFYDHNREVQAVLTERGFR